MDKLQCNAVILGPFLYMRFGKHCQMFNTESQNHLGWNIPLRSSSPTFNLALPSPPLNHVHKHTIYTFFLKTSREGDSTTSLGSLFQYLTSLSVKNFLLIPKLNLPCHNLRTFSLVLSIGAWEKKLIPSSL